MILIVDDKPENIFSLKSLLQLNLYDVDAANSGEEALKKILKNDYALIILDVQMPEMDGYEVAEAIAGYSKTKNIPIIFLSAVHIDKRFITKGYAAGGVDYVTKPFDPDLLLLKVKTFYRLQQQTKELQAAQATLRQEIEIRKKAQKALETANSHLEANVQERTKELLEANKSLKRSNAELQQYAYLASHDLQEPLRKIITFSQLIEEKFLFDAPEAKNFIGKVIAASERMRSLINDLLDYSKLSVELQFCLTDLNIELQNVLNDLELAIKDSGALVHIENLPSVDTVPGQMRQVFQNLISNALKFSKKGQPPVIRVWSERTAKKELHGKTDGSGKYLRLFVSDNGIGFDEIYREKIFTIFQRLHGRNDYEGTGIGLAIVKKIVETHDGIISAKSEEGKGATFIIVLPVTHAQSGDASVAENQNQ